VAFHMYNLALLQTVHGIISRLGKGLINLADWGWHREHCAMLRVGLEHTR
jgi:hypothetical protein